MSVVLDTFASRSGSGFLSDIDEAVRAASLAGDKTVRRRLFDLWFDHLVGDLGSKSSDALVKHLNGLQVWRRHGDWTVFKTPDPPCVAYTFYWLDDGTLVLVALAACGTYPAGGADAWWSSVLTPRLDELDS